MNECIIGIGSNIEPGKNIPQMLILLKEVVEVVRTSPFIYTKPIGIKNQPDFMNGAIMIRTPLPKEALKKVLKKIEDNMGRDRSQPKLGPRCIDLDIVVWNGEIVDQDYYTRDFLRKSVDMVL